MQEAKRRIQHQVEQTMGHAEAEEVLLFAYLDDVILGVPAAVCTQALTTLYEELELIRHSPSEDKLELWSPEALPPPDPPAAPGHPTPTKGG